MDIHETMKMDLNIAFVKEIGRLKFYLNVTENDNKMLQDLTVGIIDREIPDTYWEFAFKHLLSQFMLKYRVSNKVNKRLSGFSYKKQWLALSGEIVDYIINMRKVFKYPVVGKLIQKIVVS